MFLLCCLLDLPCLCFLLGSVCLVTVVFYAFLDARRICPSLSFTFASTFRHTAHTLFAPSCTSEPLASAQASSPHNQLIKESETSRFLDQPPDFRFSGNLPAVCWLLFVVEDWACQVAGGSVDCWGANWRTYTSKILCLTTCLVRQRARQNRNQVKCSWSDWFEPRLNSTWISTALTALQLCFCVHEFAVDFNRFNRRSQPRLISTALFIL